MGNGVAPGLHVSAFPSLCLYVLSILTMKWRILEKRTPHLCSNMWSQFHFEPLLSTTVHLMLVGNPSVCRFMFCFFSSNIQQATRTSVLSGWEKTEKRRTWHVEKKENEKQTKIIFWCAWRRWRKWNVEKKWRKFLFSITITKAFAEFVYSRAWSWLMCNWTSFCWCCY
jgi:hypothetical protein